MRNETKCKQTIAIINNKKYTYWCVVGLMAKFSGTTGPSFGIAHIGLRITTDICDSRNGVIDHPNRSQKKVIKHFAHGVGKKHSSFLNLECNGFLRTQSQVTPYVSILLYVARKTYGMDFQMGEVSG